MLLGFYLLLMQYHDWRKWTTLLDSRVPNKYDVGTMPNTYHPGFISPSSLYASRNLDPDTIHQHVHLAILARV